MVLASENIFLVKLVVSYLIEFLKSTNITLFRSLTSFSFHTELITICTPGWVDIIIFFLYMAVMINAASDNIFSLFEVGVGTLTLARLARINFPTLPLLGFDVKDLFSSIFFDIESLVIAIDELDSMTAFAWGVLFWRPVIL